MMIVQRSYCRRAVALFALAVLIIVPAVLVVYFQKTVTVEPLPLGSIIPSLRLIPLNGTEPPSMKQSMKKHLFIFFTTTCPHCHRELSLLNALYPRYRHSLEFIGVSLGEDGATSALSRDIGIRFPIVLDSGGVLRASFRVTIVPALFFIDETMVLRRRLVGESAESVLRSFFDEFLYPSRQKGSLFLK